MIRTAAMLQEELFEYGAPRNKISRMINSGELIPLVRGLYETDRNCSAHAIAGCIYGPSYISFEYALAYHGLIPERVNVVTSATFGKRKYKSYENKLGRFTYSDVPEAVFPLEVEVHREGEYPFLIATAEKALCDTLYSRRPVANQKELQTLLFDDMRIDYSILIELDKDTICILAERYSCKNVQLLSRYLRRLKI